MKYKWLKSILMRIRVIKKSRTMADPGRSLDLQHVKTQDLVREGLKYNKIKNIPK